ncbi:Ger(x)C family spore germination protein [Bacillus sinesaloumensis]|uniref:Ger(x)C family spore germination protein n=1 Tax=Litchfieldia sinesaloumensis TaxID=1926280 RepID=UPI00098888D9|nr:Ger(x)C family spore germination C-terminal domain-containing protein [Bacillus sinesaloumensis]
MKKALFVNIVCFLLVSLVGCGAKEIQSQAYITAIGIDFVDGEFVVYTQAQNFANIAKQDGTTSLQQSVPSLIGEAKAKSIQAALNTLEQNAALPFYYGHVSSIILSENVIKNELDSIIEYIGQNPFLRYNIWFLGTREDIKEILLGESFFNFPSLYTIIHNPESLIKNTMTIPIKEYNKFISSYNQPAGSFIIPSLSLNDASFSEDDKKNKVPVVSGGFAVSQQRYKGWVPNEDLVGIKWLSKEANKIPYNLFEDKVSLIMEKPTYTIKVLDGQTPSYHLTLKMNAQISQNLDNIGYSKIVKEAEKKIKEDLEKSLQKSEELQVDLLNLSEKAYRYHLKDWDLQTINSISKESIKKIDVSVKIIKTVHYKR